jgi:hypothetical protein
MTWEGTALPLQLRYFSCFSMYKAKYAVILCLYAVYIFSRLKIQVATLVMIVGRRFGETCCLHLQGRTNPKKSVFIMKMEVVIPSEALETICRCTCHDITEDFSLTAFSCASLEFESGNDILVLGL